MTMQETAGIPSEVKLGHIIDDDVKFSLKLGFKSTDEFITSGIFGILSGVAVGVTVGGAFTVSAAATATALTAAAVSNLGFFGTIGVALGLTAAPVVAPVAIPIAIPIATGVGGAVVGGSLFYFIKTGGKKFSTYGGYKSFNTSIDRLGHSIAGTIFLPIVGLEKELNSKDYNFVINEMEEWGYSKQFINFFIKSSVKIKFETIKKYDLKHDDWLKKQMKKKENKLSNKDIEIKKLKSLRMDIIKRYLKECGRSLNEFDLFK